MTENEFLISRALGVFNSQYGKDIQVEDCEIKSIPNNPQSDRGYEITTPATSEFFRIRLYVKFASMDRSSQARLEVAMPYITGALGDEVYVIQTFVSGGWGYKFDPIQTGGLPMGVITTEEGDPIITEEGLFMVMEFAAT